MHIKVQTAGGTPIEGSPVEVIEQLSKLLREVITNQAHDYPYADDCGVSEALKDMAAQMRAAEKNQETK